jgi:hypothetical protein
LVWTLVLMSASFVYGWWCPKEVREVTEVGWGHSHKPMIHYWALTWKYLWARVLCLALYVVGGAGAGWILGCKLLQAIQFVFSNQGIPQGP